MRGSLSTASMVLDGLREVAGQARKREVTTDLEYCMKQLTRKKSQEDHRYVSLAFRASSSSDQRIVSTDVPQV